MDTASDNREEDLGEQIDGVLDDGQLTSGKNVAVCRAIDQGNNPN